MLFHFSGNLCPISNTKHGPVWTQMKPAEQHGSWVRNHYAPFTLHNITLIAKQNIYIAGDTYYECTC